MGPLCLNCFRKGINQNQTGQSEISQNLTQTLVCSHRGTFSKWGRDDCELSEARRMEFDQRPQGCHQPPAGFQAVKWQISIQKQSWVYNHKYGIIKSHQQSAIRLFDKRGELPAQQRHGCKHSNRDLRNTQQHRQRFTLWSWNMASNFVGKLT